MILLSFFLEEDIFIRLNKNVAYFSTGKYRKSTVPLFGTPCRYKFGLCFFLLGESKLIIYSLLFPFHFVFDKTFLF